MNSDEQIKTIVGWMAWTTAVLSPVLLVIVLIKLIREPAEGQPINWSNGDFWFIVAFCILSFLVAVVYGKFQMGWFQKRR